MTLPFGVLPDQVLPFGVVPDPEELPEMLSLERLVSAESEMSRSEFNRMTSKQSCETYDGGGVQTHQLVNNDAAQALVMTKRDSFDRCKSLLTGLFVDDCKSAVDWDKPKNLQHLKDVLRLTRRLFWAFEEVDMQEEEKEEDTQPKKKTFRKKVAGFVQHEVFSTFFMLLTFYALFAPDILLACGHSHANPDDRSLAIANTFVLFFFIMEELLQCYSFDGYICSGRFWIDTAATVSIVGDTWMAVELVQSDAMVAGRGSRLIRLVRIGGRSGRLVRLLRVARLTQVIRLVPRLKSMLERSTQELSLLLFHKRLWHVFQFLDTEDMGVLSPEGLTFFQTAMAFTFPEKQVKTAMDRMSRMGDDLVKHASSQKLKPIKVDLEDSTFKSVVRSFRGQPAGKRAFKRCTDDIQCMKESCAIVERAIGRLTLKVCVMVLALLVMIQLLEDHTTDISVSAGLNQMDILVQDPQVAPSVICELVADTYPHAASAKLELLILQNKVYWEIPTGCISPARLVSDVEDAALDILAAYPREPHELMIEYLKNPEGVIVSVAVLDMHEDMRSDALSSFTHTVAVVVLLMTLVILFASDMKRLSNSNVLHPLWVLLDDMCALKSIEVLGEKSQDTSEVTRLTKEEINKNRYCGLNRFRQVIPVAEELLQLRKAFDKLHGAMMSWSKYVPVVLLKQLLEAGVEAKIGAIPLELTVFFCDIVDWGEICKDLDPEEVLELLGEILSGVNAAIEDNGGCLLEFIGEEVLAIFNAPMKVKDHAVRALTAALEAKEYAANLKSHSLPNGKGVKLRFGVHSATVLCGNLGSPTRMKYGVLGDGVNMTARLKSLNSRFGTQLLVSEEIMNRINDNHGFEKEISDDEMALPSPVTRVIRSRSQSKNTNRQQDGMILRTIGNLILKGRTKPTAVIEIFGKLSTLDVRIVKGASKFREAFNLYVGKKFERAKVLFEEANQLLSVTTELGMVVSEDQPSIHHVRLCEQYILAPPPDDWDGSEVMKKKAW